MQKLIRRPAECVLSANATRVFLSHYCFQQTREVVKELKSIQGYARLLFLNQLYKTVLLTSFVSPPHERLPSVEDSNIFC